MLTSPIDVKLMPVVYIQLSNGAGNNLFQYAFGQIVNFRTGLEVKYVRWRKSPFFLENVVPNCHIVDRVPLLIKRHRDIKYESFEKFCELVVSSSSDHYIFGYFEDFRFYLDCRSRLISYLLPSIPIQRNDTVLHLRTGDRLFLRSSFSSLPTSQEWREVALKYSNDQPIKICSDLKNLNLPTLDNMEKLIGHNHVPRFRRVKRIESYRYLTSVLRVFNELNAELVGGESVLEDFGLMLGARRLICVDATLSWWAGFLSDGEVRIKRPWRPYKREGKNLADVPLVNWNGWN